MDFCKTRTSLSYKRQVGDVLVNARYNQSFASLNYSNLLCCVFQKRTALVVADSTTAEVVMKPNCGLLSHLTLKRIENIWFVESCSQFDVWRRCSMYCHAIFTKLVDFKMKYIIWSTFPLNFEINVWVQRNISMKHAWIVLFWCPHMSSCRLLCSLFIH